MSDERHPETALEPGEERREVRPYLVVRICDQCRDGEMKQAYGPSFMTHPPAHFHRCDSCGYETNILGGKTYPEIRWERVS